MRNGGSVRPKCSRYSATLLLLALHSAVERRAVDAEQLRRLADVAARQAQRRLDVGALPGAQGLVQVDGSAALELARGLLQERIRTGAFRLHVELRLQLGRRDALAGVLGAEPDHDVAQ